ncbi:hypothetical protein BH10BAC3_BH10BAC3_19990 [soil metagenome]
MRSKYLPAIAVLTCLTYVNKTSSQGCSDAGFCSVGALKHQQIAAIDDSIKGKHQLSLVSSFGLGDEQVLVFTPALQYDYTASKKLSLQAKLTAGYASGNLGSAAGLGDIFLTGSYLFPLKKSWTITTTAGVKLPLNQSNLESDGRSFPMQYQSSLGTIDAIGGITLSNNKWQFSTAIQQPLSGINRNHFLPVYWDKEEAANYPSTNDFNRKGDVLLKLGRNFTVNKKLTINAGLLNIFHLGKDKYIDANVSNKPISINGSEGLTLNLTGACWWQIGNNLKLGITGGVPLVVRDVRPDGLTRSFVLSPQVGWLF